MRESFDHYRNKAFLGELTLGDLLEIWPVEGEYSLGVHWISMVQTKVSKKKRLFNIYSTSLAEDPEMSIPLDTKVRIVKNIVSMRLDWNGYAAGREFRIRLDSAPDFLFSEKPA